MLNRVCVIALALVMSFAAADAGGPVVFGHSYQIHSAVLDESREYRVHLPPSYAWAQDRSYPVLYVLDGQSHFTHSAASADYLATSGEIPEMIVVGVVSTVRVRDFTQTDWPEAWIGGGGAANFRRFLSDELIPAIDAEFRTDGYRILTGHSASGQFVLYDRASQPQTFLAHIAIAPSLDWDDGLPARQLSEAFQAQPDMRGTLFTARADDAGRPLEDFETLTHVLETDAPPHLRWRTAAYPDETHMSIALPAQIAALRDVYDGYRFHNDRLPDGFDAAQAQYADLSDRLAWTVPVPSRILNGLAYEALNADDADEAIALFGLSIADSAHSAYAHDGLAQALAQAGRWTEALTASARALALADEQGQPATAYYTRQLETLQERAAQAAQD